MVKSRGAAALALSGMLVCVACHQPGTKQQAGQDTAVGTTGRTGAITIPTAGEPPVFVSRDREGSPAPGLYNICYVNGFQAQPSEESFWLDDHPELVLRDAAGDPVIDADWDEMLLDGC